MSDPNQLYETMISETASREEIAEAEAKLREWLGRGGFPPKGMTTKDALNKCWLVRIFHDIPIPPPPLYLTETELTAVTTMAEAASQQFRSRNQEPPGFLSQLLKKLDHKNKTLRNWRNRERRTNEHHNE